MFASSSALVPSLAMSRPCCVVVMPNRSPAPFLISVMVATCLPPGVISTALPLLPLTTTRSPLGAMVMPSGACSAPPADRFPPAAVIALVRVRAAGMADTELIIVSSTYSVPLPLRARPVGARMSAALFARHGKSVPITVLPVSFGGEPELRARSRRTTVQFPVTGTPSWVVVLPPSALDTNTWADVALDFTVRSQGPTMSGFVMVSATVPWSFSTIRQPAGSRPGSTPPWEVGRLPTTTQPPGRMPSAVVSPMPPGQAWPAGSVAMLANTLVLPAGETWTTVFPVPCTLALSLKLLTRMSPAVSRPPEAGTTAIPYGFTSPLAGTVEATWVRPCNWPRNAAGCGADAGVVVGIVELAELDEFEVDVDEQAAAARPRPIMAIRILAWWPGFTVLPFSTVSAFR